MFFSVCWWFTVVMERLVNELASLLKMLDHETVSPATADKMASVRNILDSLQLGTGHGHRGMEGLVFATFPTSLVTSYASVGQKDGIFVFY